MGCTVVHVFMISVESDGRVSEALRGSCLSCLVDKGAYLGSVCLASPDLSIYSTSPITVYPERIYAK